MPYPALAFVVDCDVCTALVARVLEGQRFYSTSFVEVEGQMLTVCRECSSELGGSPTVCEVPAAISSRPR